MLQEEKCEYCSFQGRGWSLRRHKLKHDSNHVYVCDKCDREFNRKESMKRHVRTHVSKKAKRRMSKHRCKECEYFTDQKTDLIKHKRRIHDDIKENCDLCQKSFKDVQKHRREIHGVSVRTGKRRHTNEGLGSVEKALRRVGDKQEKVIMMKEEFTGGRVDSGGKGFNEEVIVIEDDE